ncbi:hypothetical protein ABZ412_13520 [Nocardia sp. NPDC005746]|uniref:hypothetical protein n=1 Tax=unclassified Nocardia TaxID=2637762 RepID=UPI0033CBBAF8
MRVHDLSTAALPAAADVFAAMTEPRPHRPTRTQRGRRTRTGAAVFATEPRAAARLSRPPVIGRSTDMGGEGPDSEPPAGTFTVPAGGENFAVG